MLEKLPILGICGFSGSGKTTLIEEAVPHLNAKGLKIAVVKHDAHRIVLDTPGKDSDRLFKSGADVFLQGQTEEFFRIHSPDESGLFHKLIDLTRQYDLVFIEGRKNIAVQKIWLLSEGEDAPPDGMEGVVSVLRREEDRLEYLLKFIDRWLPAQWAETPVYGCVLIGGKSLRMGKPKHLIEDNGKTWLEKTVNSLKHAVQKVVFSGDGEIPEEFSKKSGIERLTDVPGIEGPMAGILSCMRWAPHVSWLVVSCDLPDISTDAVNWLLSTRKPGVWATLPRMNDTEYIEPLFAHYDFRSQTLLETLAANAVFSPAQISDNSKVINISPPENLAPSWKNINSNEKLVSRRNAEVN
ncbi:molybdopterin-guanine dinucleotide biosynthesis protein B [Candidatus Latescibacterota bacterium]